MVLTPVPQQDTGNLDQPQIVGGSFLVTHQNRPALRKPAQRALHHPTPRRITFLAHLIELLFCDAPDVWDVVAFLREFSGDSLVITFVQPQVLRSALGRLWALDHHGIERGFQELEVGYVRPGYHYRQRTSVSLDQEGALLDLRRFRGLFQTENGTRKGEQCHEQTPPTHRSFAEKLSGWLGPPTRSIPSPGSLARSVSQMAPLGTG